MGPQNLRQRRDRERTGIRSRQSISISTKKSGSNRSDVEREYLLLRLQRRYVVFNDVNEQHSFPGVSAIEPVPRAVTKNEQYSLRPGTT